MKKSGFTLIELIFVIVIIGVLAATAIPKFNDLKLNAEVSNMVKPYATLIETGKATYLNEIDLNGNTIGGLGIDDFLTVSPLSYTTTGKGWQSVSADSVRYWIQGTSGQRYMTYTYGNNGTLTIFTLINGAKKDSIQTKLTNQTGMIFVNDRNTTILNFTN